MPRSSPIPSLTLELKRAYGNAVVIPRPFGRMESDRLHRQNVRVDAELPELARCAHQLERGRLGDQA